MHLVSNGHTPDSEPIIAQGNVAIRFRRVGLESIMTMQVYFIAKFVGKSFSGRVLTVKVSNFVKSRQKNLKIWRSKLLTSAVYILCCVKINLILLRLLIHWSS